MRIITYLFILLIILLGVTFAVLNQDPVIFHYYLGEHALPLSLLLVLFFVMGCGIGLLVGFWILLKLKLRNYRLQQHVKLVEKEIENLRAIPLQDRH